MWPLSVDDPDFDADGAAVAGTAEDGENARRRNPLTVKRYKVEGIPTLLLFRGGELLWSHEGVLHQAKLQQVLTERLAG